MSLTPEGAVKNKVKRWLKDQGIWFFMPMQNGMGRVGIPDFICCHGGKFLAIETKAPGKRMSTSANQERELMAIRAARGIALVVDDVKQLEEMETEGWRYA